MCIVTFVCYNQPRDYRRRSYVPINTDHTDHRPLGGPHPKRGRRARDEPRTLAFDILTRPLGMSLGQAGTVEFISVRTSKDRVYICTAWFSFPETPWP